MASSASSASKPSSGRPRRAVFPLWAKLGLFFGTMMAAFIALYGWLGFRHDLQREATLREQHLLGLATSTAAAIDGDEHQGFSRAQDMARPEYQQVLKWLKTVMVAHDLLYANTICRDGENRFAYVLDASKGPMPLGYPIFDIGEGQLQAFAGQAAYTQDMEDEWGRYDAFYAPIRNRQGEVVAILELDADADARDLWRRDRLRRLLIEIALGVLIALGAALVFARYVNRHLSTLTTAALALAEGDLEREVSIRSRDEIGLLGLAFNDMLQGLRQREIIRETFGRFVTEEIAAQALADPDRLRGGEAKQVTILMSDLRGFTSLSEQLGPKGMVGLLNRYLARMSEVIIRHSGTINEFTGDGIVAFFGAPESRADDALRAVACAVAMQRELTAFNQDEGRELEMGIGINTGVAIAGIIGSDQRMKYTVVGEVINLAARLESISVGSQVLISAASLDEVREHVEVGDHLELHAKGKREPVRCYPLLAVGPPHDLSMPQRPEPDEVQLDCPAICWRLAGKQVSHAEPLAATVTHLGRHTLRLLTEWQPELLSNLKLQVRLTDEVVLEDLYGKVVGIDRLPRADDEPAGAVELLDWDEDIALAVHLTSVPDPERRKLERFRAKKKPPAT